VNSENDPITQEGVLPEGTLASGGLDAKGVTKKRTTSKASPRTRAREFAVQALYQFIVGKNIPGDVDQFTRGLSGFNKADSVHYDLLLYGISENFAELDALITPLLDRPLTEISPIERSVMWIGAYELKHCIEIPYKVVMNECIELAKEFGGTDGHKYVNAVLNGLSLSLRTAEMNRK
jgi:N utilization substance protein B